MNATLAHRLDAAAPFMPSSLVSPAAYQRLKTIAAQLPVQIAPGFLLECRLHESDQVDLSVALTKERSRDLLLDRSSAMGLPEHFFEDKAWQRIRQFCRTWIQPRSALNTSISKICLEFDLPSTPNDESCSKPRMDPFPLPVPGVFVQMPSPTTFGDAHRRIYNRTMLRRVLDALDGAHRTVSSVLALNHAVSSLPPTTHLGWTAVMFSRTERTASCVRLCVHGFSRSTIERYLRAVHWPGDIAATCKAVAPYLSLASSITLAFDVSDRVQPRIGFELRTSPSSCTSTDRDSSQRVQCLRDRTRPPSPYAPLLDRLAKDGLLTDEKRSACLAWPGLDRVPGRRSQDAALIRVFDVVKVVCTPDQDPTAKIYPGVRHVDL